MQIECTQEHSEYFCPPIYVSVLACSLLLDSEK